MAVRGLNGERAPAVSLMHSSAGKVISTILRHDAKVTSYKIALIRALADVALSFPEAARLDTAVAVPLRLISAYWVAYYWPFVDAEKPIWQGPRNQRAEGMAADMAFRGVLTRLKQAWEGYLGAASSPADGYLVMSEMRLNRRRESYPPSLVQLYDAAVAKIAATVEMPVRYAGPGMHTVFPKPMAARRYEVPHQSLPGADAGEKSVLVTADLWRDLVRLSLWVEALAVHEWCLFSEQVDQRGGRQADRGDVYRLLTARPDSRRPLTWERNQVDILLMQGRTFRCPWTRRAIAETGDYDLDHIVPVAVYPTNELWNLVPSDSTFNQHQKRDRLPSVSTMREAEPALADTYGGYLRGGALRKALLDDSRQRFQEMDDGGEPRALVAAVTSFVATLGEARNLARF